MWEVLAQSLPNEVSVGAPVTNHYEIPVDVGSEVVVLLQNGTFVRTKVVRYAQASTIAVADVIPGAKAVVFFITPAAGVIGGKEVTIEAKRNTIDTLEKKIAQTTDEKTREHYRKQIQTTQQEIDALLRGNTTSVGLYAQMNNAAILALEINVLQIQIAAIKDEQNEIERVFVEAMGN